MVLIFPFLTSLIMMNFKSIKELQFLFPSSMFCFSYIFTLISLQFIVVIVAF